MDDDFPQNGIAAMGRGPVYSFEGHVPRIAVDAFIAPSAAVIGNVEIGSRSSVWFHCVLRGDTNLIRIGARCNVQDGTIIHVDHDEFATIIGDDVTIGHAAIVHAKVLDVGADGDHPAFDLGACFALLRESGYTGPLSIEFEGKGDEHRGIVAAKGLIERYVGDLVARR